MRIAVCCSGVVPISSCTATIVCDSDMSKYAFAMDSSFAPMLLPLN